MAAHAGLTIVYSLVWTLALLGRCWPRGPWRPTGRIIVTGTFHNPNWYLSHIRPLTRSGLREVVLVVDKPQQPLPGVRFVCPPPWLACLTGRAAAKALWLVVAGLRCRGDLFMGYTVLPGACAALVAGSLLGRPTCYQMTGGPIEVLGGGVHKEGPLTRSLGRPSMWLERLALAVVRRFDLVVVRGRRAKHFLREHGHTGRVAVITGSLAPPAQGGELARDIDMVYVGRLAPVKQPWQFLEVVSAVRQARPGVRAAVVGDGPLLDALRRQAQDLRLDGQLDLMGQRPDVEALLARARTFLLTSRSEGLSIALAEAMAAGTVPVVADVGELDELVAQGENGYLVAPGRIDEYAARVVSLLEDEAAWSRCSQAARQRAMNQCSLDAVSLRWRRHLTRVIAEASGAKTHPTQ